MGRDLHYVPGSFYRTDDRTGFPTRAERTRKQWNGIIVAVDVFEPRQPQDLVRGVKDKQSVPNARPLAPNVFLGPTFTTLTAAAAVGQTVIQVDAVGGFQTGDSVSVMLDTGVNFTTTLAAPPGAASLTLTRGLVGAAAASGNTVTNNTTHIPAEP